MIEIINPGWPSLIVDGGRFGEAAVGVPPSSALDHYACKALQRLTGHIEDTPALEVMGASFALRFHHDVTCAITGARVKATVDDKPVRPWTSFRAAEGSLLRIQEVVEGLRYYIGFSGTIALESVIGSFTTNLECCFGGYRGRVLEAGDRLAFKEIPAIERRAIPENKIPRMHPPHRLRVLAGPEMSFFTDESLLKFMDKGSNVIYDVSTQTNRTGIRLEGEPLVFRQGAGRSIISEGILPGTVQIPGDGRPIIMLHERTIGGYARVALVAKADHDRLAHLKPGDPVLFDRISLEEAQQLWEAKWNSIDSLDKIIVKLK
jgi:antagonist of KipI